MTNPELLRERPWATVWRADRPAERGWLKVNSAATGYESRLLGLLVREGPALVPAAVPHPEQPWAWVSDAGRPARGLDRSAAVELWCGLLPRYAEVQRSVPVAELLTAGVPDARPDRLPELLTSLLDDTAWTSVELAPELTEPQRTRIAALPGPLADAATRLADGPATLQHDDLHSGNVFIDGAGAVRVIDWGDACVAHPFGTLLVTLRALAFEWQLPPEAAELRRVRAAYLEPWRVAGESDAELARQLDLALRTAPLARAASWRRALGTPAAALAWGFADSLARWLDLTAEALAEPSGRGRSTLG